VTTRGSGRPYLLYVGMRTFHKNFDVVARAMARAHPDLELVLAGGGPLTSAEQMRLQELGLADRVRQLTPSDEDLRALYRSALAFVFSSRYEGFGLPVIEAMASGCPTLLASTAVFREIAGDDAEYFAPDDEDALAAAIDRMVDDDSHRTSLIARGRLRAAEFTWTRTAAATAAAYRAVRDA
jgi:glycosyltransferase involved in cell wall biosynthesis